jgi:hypothetical protein
MVKLNVTARRTSMSRNSYPGLSVDCIAGVQRAIHLRNDEHSLDFGHLRRAFVTFHFVSFAGEAHRRRGNSRPRLVVQQPTKRDR